MRTLLNLVIGGLVLWAASHLFPTIVRIDSVSTLILATLLICVISFCIGLACLFIMGIGVVFENCLWVIAGIILVLFSEILAMSILSNKLDGFMIVGFWPKVLLSICFSLLHIKAPNKD